MNKIINWHKAWCERWRQAMKMSHYGTYWVSFFKGVILVLLILALTGCSIGEKKIKIFSVEKPREKLDYPMPTPLQMEEIKWIIITSDNANEVFKKLEAAGIDPVLFGITDKDFQVLARNFAQIRQKLQETNSLLEEYKKYYETESNGDKSNQ
jgi:hypothetical protein|tara:strand:- start:673 stop:1131 length:459 start_codon:yes stop_codon:yes gene_type:complete